MKSIGRSQWLETVGVIAIVISLVLVAIEIRQNTNAAAAQAVMALTQEVNENDRSVINDPELADLMVRGNADSLRAEGTVSSLSSADFFRLERAARSRFNVHLTAYMYYKKGLLDESDYAGWREGICVELKNPGMRLYWNQNPTRFDAEFKRDADSRCR